MTTHQIAIFRPLLLTAALAACFAGCGSDDNTRNDGDSDTGGSDTGGSDTGGSDTGGADVISNDCPTVTATCGAVIVGPGTTAGTTVGGENTASGSCGVGGQAPEARYVFVAPFAAEWTFSTDSPQTTFDTGMYLLSGECGGDEFLCDDDGGSGTTSALSMDMDACDSVTIVIDGFSTESGAFELIVSTPEILCTDGIDNDGDGDADCDDFDCIRNEECATDDGWDAEWTLIEDAILAETNRNRRAGATCRGDDFPPVGDLEMDEFLRRSARAHSLDMATQNYFEHTGLDGREPYDRMVDAGFTGAFPTGENIAAGNRTADAVVGQWMTSNDGHCEAIMNGSFTVIGVGFAEDASSEYRSYQTQNFGGSH